jgi:hypothetical protein
MARTPFQKLRRNLTTLTTDNWSNLIFFRLNPLPSSNLQTIPNSQTTPNFAKTHHSPTRNTSQPRTMSTKKKNMVSRHIAFWDVTFNVYLANASLGRRGLRPLRFHQQTTAVVKPPPRASFTARIPSLDASTMASASPASTLPTSAGSKHDDDDPSTMEFTNVQDLFEVRRWERV